MSDTLEHEIRELRSLYWNEERDPEGRAFAPLADAYRRSGDIDQALELLDDGLSRHPGFTSGHLVSAWVHQARGDEVEAESAFRTVLELDDDNATAMHGLGRILAARGEEAGVEMVMRAQKLDPVLRRPGGAAPPAVPIPQPAETRESGDEIVDLAALAPQDGDDVLDLTALAPESDDDDVLDLTALAPESDDDDVLDLTALAPESDDDDVLDLTALAPESDDDDVLDLTALAPETYDDDVMDLAALAPETFQTEDETVVDMAALAPASDRADSGEADDDAIFDLAMLAPEPADADASEDEEDDGVVDLAALAPASPGPKDDEAEEDDADENDAIFDLAMLAPESADADADASEDEEDDGVVDLAALAPASPGPKDDEAEEDDDADENDAIFDLAMLAPEPAESAESDGADVDDEDAVFDMAMLASEDEDEDEDEDESEVLDLAALAPAEVEDEVEVVELAALAPEPSVDSSDDEDSVDVVELEALAPGVEDDPADVAQLAAPKATSVPPGAPDGWAMTEEELLAEGEPEHLEDKAAGLGVGVMTRTMAELFVKQGLGDRAVEIYEKLVADAPENEALAARLEELREAGSPRAASTGRAPAGVKVEERHDEIADGLANSQPDPHGVTPFAWTEDEPAESEVASPGAPVAGYFSQLLSWSEQAEKKKASAAGDEASRDGQVSPAADDSDDDADGPDEDAFFNAWVDRP